MTTFSVAEAKNTLSKLIDRALEGEEVVITRHGKPVVEIRPTNRTTADATALYERLRAHRRSGPSVGLTSVQLLDMIYDPDDPDNR